MKYATVWSPQLGKLKNKKGLSRNGRGKKDIRWKGSQVSIMTFTETLLLVPFLVQLQARTTERIQAGAQI